MPSEPQAIHVVILLTKTNSYISLLDFFILHFVQQDIVACIDM